MSKRTFHLLLMAILFAISTVPAWASQVSFKEVKAYLEKTVQLHEPEDKSINSAAYDYPAVNIVPLWQKLGVQFAPLKEKDDTYVFGCKPGQQECFLSYPQVDIIEKGDIKIIRITKSTPWDYQYLFFRRDGNEFFYFDHLEYDMQKYEEPDLVFLENDLLALKILSGTGTDTISYTTELIQITKDGVKKPLSFITKHERQGWGLCFDETVNSWYKYVKGVLTLNYDVKVMMNDNNYESKVKGELSKKPIIHAKRLIVFLRKPEGFVFDKEKSNVTLEDIEKLHWGGYSDYYEAFKDHFDALQRSNLKNREWIEFFMKELSESVKNKES